MVVAPKIEFLNNVSIEHNPVFVSTSKFRSFILVQLVQLVSRVCSLESGIPWNISLVANVTVPVGVNQCAAESRTASNSYFRNSHL
jgi:hypothetical protein